MNYSDDRSFNIPVFYNPLFYNYIFIYIFVIFFFDAFAFLSWKVKQTICVRFTASTRSFSH
jgi:hypothetical protein